MKNTMRVERAIKNITQADLADLIGVSRQTIDTIESNKYVPSTVLALRNEVAPATRRGGRDGGPRPRSGSSTPRPGDRG